MEWGIEQAPEYLRLDAVEAMDAASQSILQHLIMQSVQGKERYIQTWGVAVRHTWHDQVFEGDDDLVFCPHPSIRDEPYGDGRRPLRGGNGYDEVDVERVGSLTEEHMRELQDGQALVVFYPQPERLHRTVHFRIPFEFSRNPCADLEDVGTKWAQCVGNANGWELLCRVTDGRPMPLVEMHKVPEFRGAHLRELGNRVVICEPLEVVEYLCLERELLQRLVEWPQSLLDSLAHSHQDCANPRPLLANCNLQKRADNSSSVLGRVGLVGDESKIFWAVPTDIGLEKNVHLALAGIGLALSVYQRYAYGALNDCKLP